MKKATTPAKFALTKTTVTRFAKARPQAGLAGPTSESSIVPTTSVF